MSATNGVAPLASHLSDHPVLRATREGADKPSGDRLLTANDLADRWRLASKSAVYRLTSEGVIPTVKLGKFYRYRLTDIEKFEANGGA